jgi:hypothetical protein
VRAVAEVDDNVRQGLAGPVEGAPGEAGLTGGPDHIEVREDLNIRGKRRQAATTQFDRSDVI